METSFGFEKRMDAERNLISDLQPKVNAKLILDFIENYPVRIGVPTKVKKMTRLRLAAKSPLESAKNAVLRDFWLNCHIKRLYDNSRIIMIYGGISRY